LPLQFQLDQYVEWYPSIKKEHMGFYIHKHKRSIFYIHRIICLTITYLTVFIRRFLPIFVNTLFFTSLSGLISFFDDVKSFLKPQTTYRLYTISNQLCMYVPFFLSFSQSKHFVDKKEERSKTVKKKCQEFIEKKKKRKIHNLKVFYSHAYSHFYASIFFHSLNILMTSNKNKNKSNIII